MLRIKKTFDKKGVMIESTHTDEYVKFIVENEIEEVHISELYYVNNDLAFLLMTPNLKIINISSSHIKDFHSVYSLRYLVEIILDEPISIFDFSKINSNLKIVRLGYNKNIVGLDILKDLEVLDISNYRSNQNELEKMLASDHTLKSLRLINCKINSTDLYNFEVVSKCKNLESLTIDYCKNLSSWEGITELADQLEVLSISNAKKLSVSEELYELKNLKILSLNGIKAIENLDFLKYFPKLETFIFMETNILDGDLTSIIEHPTITYVGMVNKRHYNIKREKLKELLAEKKVRLSNVSK